MNVWVNFRPLICTKNEFLYKEVESYCNFAEDVPAAKCDRCVDSFKIYIVWKYTRHFDTFNIFQPIWILWDLFYVGWLFSFHFRLLIFFTFVISIEMKSMMKQNGWKLKNDEFCFISVMKLQRDSDILVQIWSVWFDWHKMMINNLKTIIWLDFPFWHPVHFIFEMVKSSFLSC